MKKTLLTLTLISSLGSIFAVDTAKTAPKTDETTKKSSWMPTLSNPFKGFSAKCSKGLKHVKSNAARYTFGSVYGTSAVAAGLAYFLKPRLARRTLRTALSSVRNPYIASVLAAGVLYSGSASWTNSFKTPFTGPYNSVKSWLKARKDVATKAAEKTQ